MLYLERKSVYPAILPTISVETAVKEPMRSIPVFLKSSLLMILPCLVMFFSELPGKNCREFCK